MNLINCVEHSSAHVLYMYMYVCDSLKIYMYM